MRREYIKVPKSFPLPLLTLGVSELKELNDEFWKNEIFHHLLAFYQNYDTKELKDKIEREKKKKHPRTEREIAKFIRVKLNGDRQFGYMFKVFGESTNDEDVEGNYDIIVHSTNWKSKDFHFECKNLDNSQDLVNKYVAYNKGHSIFDGGVYRYFNGKYAQNLNFGGMIGFVLEGNISEIKNKILKKLEDKFDITPKGDLLSVADNSIEENKFTFDSKHERKNKSFLIHHLLFDFN
ncbi:MAG: hypothetical protein GKR88_10760 [Flavobacteriaceae bacterium]|nr:MAG: hypothetical protein GKR88_10760 [Flavobacteriaceae bacterium]